MSRFRRKEPLYDLITGENIYSEDYLNGLRVINAYEVFYRRLCVTMKNVKCNSTNTNSLKILYSMSRQDRETVSSFLDLNDCKCDCEAIVVLTLLMHSVIRNYRLPFKEKITPFCEYAINKRGLVIVE